MKNTLRTFSFLLMAAIAANLAYAGNKAPKGYLTDSSGNIVRNSYGECWHTGSWTKADAVVVGCDGVVAKTEPVAAANKSEPSSNENAAAADTPDTSNKAADSAAAAPVAAAPASEKVTFETDTLFGFDRADLQPGGKAKLEDLVSKLQGTDIEIIVATGHTDSTGPASYNEKLSMRRAQAVAKFLIAKGLPADRIFAKGKGELQPVASNKTAEGRAKNRRVDIEVVGKRNK